MIAVTRPWPTFVLIWAGQFVSALGSGLTAFALDVWVFQRTGSITQFALATLFFVLPRVLIAPLAGVVVDRWNRRTVKGA
jgi:MFS transporter, DHA3 family, macrolide efflux protein